MSLMLGLLAQAAASTVAPITDDEITTRAAACTLIIQDSNAIPFIATKLHLDTPEKQREFVVQCRIFVLGVQVGINQATTSSKL